ncbi:branched-chain amino acid ABC transporter permease [Lachnospiraceae bacterium ZAX-1]
MQAFVAQCINGIATGSIYALIVLGMNLLVLVRKVTYHGYSHIIMLSMGVCWLTLKYTDENIPLAVIVMFLFAVVLTIITEPLFRPLARRGADLETIVVGMGIGIIITEIMSQYVNQGASFSFPKAMTGGGVMIGTGLISFSLANVITLLAAVVVVALLMAFLYKTRQGRALRAIAQNLKVAKTLGISFEKTGLIGFGIAGLLAGATALFLIMSLGYAGPTLGDTFAVKALILILFAGMGNLKGGIICAVLMGLVEAMALAFLPGRWTEAVFYGFIMVIILWKPQGLFGSKT